MAPPSRGTWCEQSRIRMPALPALWQLQGSQPAAVFRGKCTCWGAGVAPSFCMSLPDSMGQWSQIKKKKTELRERKRRKGVGALIVLAAAGIWITLLAIIGLAVIAETMNILHEMA